MMEMGGKGSETSTAARPSAAPGWVCGSAGFAGCELRLAFKGMAFLILTLNCFQLLSNSN